MSVIKANDRMPCSYPVTGKSVRRLFQSQTNDCSADSPCEDTDCLTVFLRIKPSPDVKCQKNSIEITDNQKLICKPPITAKSKKTDYVEYTFSRIFGPDTKQEEVFRGCVVPRVQDLIDGKNSLIFAYGTTCSGKTYTVQGTATNPGLIPRTLHTIFSHIRPDREVKYAPIFAKEVENLDHAKRRDELIKKEKLFREHNNLAKSFKAGSCASLVTESKNFLEILEEDFVELRSTMPTCTVWISFIELYNEQIFDLLDSKKALKLAMDQNNNFYAKGLRYICVDSTEEAYSVYKLGRQNSSVASTRMNDASSRSHCIFTIKIINHDRKVALSSLSICDLAGTERQAKAQNSGARIKESGTINESIFHLNKCLRAIRENQNRNAPQMIPYRDSNLTKLFHSAFQEKTDEKIAMIVNINPTAELYDETQQVLKVCAIACEIRKTIVPSKTIEQSSNGSANDDFELGNEYSSYDEFSSENLSEFDSEKTRRKLNQMKMELERLADENQDLTQMNEAQNNHIQLMTDEMNKLRVAHEKQRAETKELYESELAYYKAKLTDASRALSVGNAHDMDVEEIVNEKESRIQKLKTLLEKKEQEGERMEEKYREKLSRLERELDEKTQALQQKQNLVDSFEEKIEELTQKLSDTAVEHEEILVHLEKDRDTKSLQLASAEAQIVDLKAKIQRLETQPDEMVQRLKTAEDRVKELESELERCKAKQDAALMKAQTDEVLIQELTEQLMEKKRPYNTRSAARTPLKSIVRENTVSDYQSLIELPMYKSKKSKVTEKIITICAPDDSMENDFFKVAKKEIERDNKENDPNGMKGKKKLLNPSKSPAGHLESLISFDSSDMEVVSPFSSTEVLTKSKSNVATPAQTIKSMKKKHLN